MKILDTFDETLHRIRAEENERAIARRAREAAELKQKQLRRIHELEQVKASLVQTNKRRRDDTNVDNEDHPSTQKLRRRSPAPETATIRYAPEKHKRPPTINKIIRDVIVPTSKHEPLQGPKPSEFKGSQVPDWYERARVRNERNYKRGQAQELRNVGRLLEDCLRASSQQSLKQKITELRNEIHRIEFLPYLPDDGGIYIKRSHVLESLRTIIRNESDVFPKDIISDARVLRDRWWEGNFEPDLLRGVKTSTGIMKDKKKVPAAYALKSDWEWRKDAKRVGDNGLCVGQWWPLRICALRDGGHGELEAGISGEKGKGVFAIIIADGGYKNEQLTADEAISSNTGDEIWYCGTESNDENPTRSTGFMLDAFKFHPDQPIRVLRGASKFSCAPSIGIRYDGLYHIVGHELVNKNTAMYRFHMKRLRGQDPIRANGELARPNKYEIQENKKLKLYVREYTVE